MSKRNNITYVKPQEPSFLAKLKAEIGYKEGPSVETKRQRLESDPEDYDSGEDSRPEREDEQPQVVVLRPGDLSAEEAKTEKQLAAKELAEKRADLTQPIVFKQRVKQPNIEEDKSQTENSKKTEKSGKKSEKSKSKKSKVASSKLSFNEDEEDDTAED
ncbi:uncharacterized protein KIAA1143 homolog [Drosophila rhopaloa]|uniref:Uncharacterized protein KIAA1143 homolog n=1 Tax=Drosophila rhopaloa TaxID=1041015 RepID=A0A6P4G2D2_DRORH|nr:uncharacterized protein KIAA1143 homolog [Drosophila rhopaloa]